MPTITLDAARVRAAVPMPAAVAVVRAALADLAAGSFEMPARTVLGAGSFLVMAAHHRPTGSAIVKTLSLSFTRVPAIIGTVAYTDTASDTQLVADAAAVTSLRTGAIVGVATDLLAPADAGDLVLIGAGGQAADQVRAVHAVRPLRSLVIVNRDRGRAERLLAELRAEAGADGGSGGIGDIPARVSTSPADCLPHADLVCCATSAATPLFAADLLADRVHVNAIGSYRPTMRELPAEVLADATVVVDERSAALAESGEIRHAIESGVLAADDLVELGSALRQGPPPHRGRPGRTVFKTVGIAAQDWAVARLLAAGAGAGWLPSEGE